MKKFFSIALLAAAVSVSAPAGAAQDSGGAAKGQKVKTQAATSQTARTSGKADKKDGTDCSPQRAGVRCSRPKPKKPWFFGS